MKDGQTIGQWLKWDFEGNGSLQIRDKNGKLIYYENSNGYIIDKRTPEVIEHNGRKYQLIP